MNKISQPSWIPCSARPRIAWSVFVLALLCLPAFAEQKTPPPIPPFFAKPAPGTTWSVEITEKGVPAKKEEPSEKTDSPEGSKELQLVRPVRLEVKFGRNRILQGIITYSDKSSMEYYVVDDSLLQVYSNSPSIASSSMAMEPFNLFSLRVPAFPGLGWLSVDNFVGIEMIKGAESYRFHTTTLPNDAVWDTELTALIRVEDRHPVRIAIGSTEYNVSEIAPFSGEIQLPPEFQAKLAEVRKQTASRETLRRINERTSR